MDTWSGWCRGVLDINDPCHIVTSSSGQNIAVGCDLTIRVFDHRGKFEKFFRIPALFADKENIRNRLKNRSCLEYILYIAFMLIIYILVVSGADIIGFIAKLDGNSLVSCQHDF